VARDTTVRVDTTVDDGALRRVVAVLRSRMYWHLLYPTPGQRSLQPPANHVVTQHSLWHNM
jgi:hypothetical protein